MHALRQPPVLPAGFPIDIDMVSMLVNLIISVLVPSLLGKVRGWLGGWLGGWEPVWAGRGWAQAHASCCQLRNWQKVRLQLLPSPALLRSTPPSAPRRPSCLQALRDLVPAVRAFVTNHRVGLSLFSTLNLALIVWQVLSGAQSIREWRWRSPLLPCHAALSNTAMHCFRLELYHCTAADPALCTAASCAPAVMDQPFVGLVYVILLSAGQHLVYLAFNFAVTT